MSKYKIYIISKGRHDVCYTAKHFLENNVDFNLVVEPQELDLYKEHFDEKIIITTPFQDLGLGSIPVRNFVWEHSKKLGHKSHWIFDDNIRSTRYLWKGRKVNIDPAIAISEIEKFTDRYENIAIIGMNYSFFVRGGKLKPYALNKRVFSNLLINNNIEQRWRGRYNEDTDLSLQVLVNGYCTVLFNVFSIDKTLTMSMKGGNATELYQGDGRLKMAKDLERQWPYVVKTVRKFNRPQHEIIRKSRQFNQQLIRRKDIDWDKIKEEKINLKIKQINEVKNDYLKKAVEDYNE